jgi:hypothetical protein
MKMTKIGQFFLAGTALALAGCASVSVEPVSEVAVNRMPQRVYVEPFSMAGAEFNVDREGTELAEFKSG